MINAIIEHGPAWGLARTCAAFGVARATLYRKRATLRFGARTRRNVAPPRHLSAAQRAEVLNTLHESRFADLAPAQVHAILLSERRGVRSHRNAKKPELLATKPNQLWS